MAGAGRKGLLRISRRADQLPGIARLPPPRHCVVAVHATASQPEGSHDVEADREDRIRLSPAANNPSSLATDALCRHTPKVGAACGNSARAVLCGGRSVTTVPTANRKAMSALRPLIPPISDMTLQRSERRKGPISDIVGRPQLISDDRAFPIAQIRTLSSLDDLLSLRSQASPACDQTDRQP